MATLQFYPIEVTYKIVNNKASIYLFGRTPNNEQVCVVDENFEPYFYVEPKEDENTEFLIRKLLSLKVEKRGSEGNLKNAEVVDKKLHGRPITVIKVTANLPPSVPALRNAIKELKEVENAYEADIPFVRRYLIDKGIIPMTLTQAEGDFINARSRVPVFSVQKISRVSEEDLKEPKIIAVDIETYNPTAEINAKKNPILMIAFYGKNFKKVITWKKFKTESEDIEFVESESALLEETNRLLRELSPDILAGYFSDSFDWPYIKERAEKYGIKLDFGPDHSQIKTNLRTGSSELGGITSFDLYKFVQRIVGRKLNTESYKLSEVAEELIGEGKLDEAKIEKLAESWDENKNLETYCKYNLQDAKITYKLAEKLLPNALELVKIVGLPISDIIGMGFSQLVEWYLLRQAPQFNEIAPNKPTHHQMRERLTKTYTGGFVYEPKPGLYKNIVVFDFRSMYPSIIASHNISPGTLNCRCCKDEAKLAPVEKGKYWFCEKKKGFIPKMVEELIKRRMRVKEIMKKNQDEKTKKLLDARQESLKVLSNSFYGYLAFAAARWYSIESALSVTAYERNYIKDVIEKAKKEGFEVIYGDTDSVFLLLKKKTKQDALRFKDKINLELPELMELDYEGLYPSGLFVAAKAKEYGAKKKYALLSEEGFIKIKGFETVRKNWSEIAKETQEKVLKTILEKGDVEKAFEYVKKVIHDLQDRKVPIEKTILRTQLQKNITAYESIGPHVAVAARMQKAGTDIGAGSIIRYVIVSGTGKIRDRAKTIDELNKDESYDPAYYIENQVVPAVETIFAVLGYKKEDLIADRKQSSLKGFMK
ncbi:DNA-directed DNA polymerase [Candidatus Woesearchaeota archaeon]|nr:DNA-directed DNA polymerase [Candidatus Woesearchaeota archaeon]